MTGARLVLGDWDELGPHAAAVRLEVFVREQGIPESLEWDEHDAPSLHCVAFDGARAVGTGRLLPDGRIGRMAVSADQRRGGLGGRILERLVEAARERGDREARLSAQTYVLDFYRRHGFAVFGGVYQEAGIDHQDMRRALWGGRIELRHWHEPGSGGQRLAVSEWRPAFGHGGGVYLLHGLGEHRGRYDTLARWWCARGWRVRAHDHAGHGESEGARGVIRLDDQLIRDAQTLLAGFERDLGRPPLLLGHSLGGALAAQLVTGGQARVAGLVLSSPALAIRLSAPLALLAALLRRLAPALALGNGLDPASLSHDTEVVAAYRADPLVHDRICARLLMWLRDAGDVSRRLAPGLEVPVLLMVAGDDQLVDPQGSRAFAAAAPAALLQLHWYPRHFHELFNELGPDRDQVLADLQTWLFRVFPPPPAA